MPLSIGGSLGPIHAYARIRPVRGMAALIVWPFQMVWLLLVIMWVMVRVTVVLLYLFGVGTVRLSRATNRRLQQIHAATSSHR